MEQAGPCSQVYNFKSCGLIQNLIFLLQGSTNDKKNPQIIWFQSNIVYIYWRCYKFSIWHRVRDTHNHQKITLDGNLNTLKH